MPWKTVPHDAPKIGPEAAWRTSGSASACRLDLNLDFNRNLDTGAVNRKRPRH